MKIVELCNYSAGICGVWTRVREEAQRLAKKHEVRVFSSDRVKGSPTQTVRIEKLGDILIRRAPAYKLGGESYMIWLTKTVEQEIIQFRPDIIIAHSYRHPHTTRGCEIAKKTGAKSFLVTHAPFSDTQRSLLSKQYISLIYDPFIGKETLSSYDKIIAITKWELPFLKKLGVSKSKISYIPNGIPEEFFTLERSSQEKNILFLGRIAPVKDIQTLIKSLTFLKDTQIKLELVGPAETNYKKMLEKIIDENFLTKKIIFSGPVYQIEEKIKKIDSAKIFVLPSKRESMPQSLMEALARKKIVIASNNQGSSELIKDGKNGFLFRVGDSKHLSEKIEYALKGKHLQLRDTARRSVEEFSWEKVIQKFELLF